MRTMWLRLLLTNSQRGRRIPTSNARALEVHTQTAAFQTEVCGKLKAVPVLGLALLVLAGSPAAADSVNVCGALAEYRAPTSTVPGSITVGSEQFAISTDAKQDTAPGTTTVGAQVCLTGTWVMSQTVGRNLTDFQLRAATATGTARPVASPAT